MTCVTYYDVNKECPIVDPVFDAVPASDNIYLPEINVVDTNSLPDIDTIWSRLTRVFSGRKVSTSSTRRQIPYLIGTEYQNGHYNTTFTWESVERILRLIERFKLVKYNRVMRNARLNIIQTNRDLGRGIAAVANKSKGLIRINPTFNFGRNLGYCDRVMLHENFHLTGSANHTNPNDPRPLMHMYGGTLPTLLPIDETYITVYPWVVAERFSTTANLFSQILAATDEYLGEYPYTGGIECGLEKSWADRWGSWVAP
jgi:hypothetical protein